MPLRKEPSKQPITKTQLRCLYAIRLLTAKNRRVPTLEQIAKCIGRGISTAWGCAVVLKRDGYLVKRDESEKSSSRDFILTRKGVSALQTRRARRLLAEEKFY